MSDVIQEEERERSSYSPLTSATFWFSLVLGYLLSPGVLVFLIGDISPPAPWDRFVETVFAPIIWVYNAVPAVERFYDAYFEFCDFRS